MGESRHWEHPLVQGTHYRMCDVVRLVLTVIMVELGHWARHWVCDELTVYKA